jgi:hypothetical protein
MSGHNRLRGTYHRAWHPGQAECEQHILIEWQKLCEVADEHGGNSRAERIYTNALHDLGIMRAQTMAWDTAITSLHQHVHQVLPS